MLRGFEQLLELVYDAPLRDDGFTPFLEMLARVTDSRGASFKWVADGQLHFMTGGLETALVTTYAQHFAHLDPWAARRVAVGTDLFGTEVVSRREVEKSAFYNDFGRRQGFVDLHKMTFGSLDTRQDVSLALLKSSAIDPTRRDAEDERRLTTRLMPHIARALAIADLTQGATRAASLVAALDRVPAAAFFLDDRGRVRAHNAAASRLLAKNDGLELDDGELRIEAPYEAFSLPVSEHDEESMRLGLDRALLVRDTTPSKTAEDILVSRYGLTAAERVVVMRVARGESPREIADALGSSWHTIRTHLRSAFAKTGVNRQSALARLVGSL